MQDLASGYMSGKLLLKLEAVAFMLAHHTSQYYTFLDCPVNSRNRTMYYSTLARLLFMEDTPQQFKTFVLPLQQVSHQCARSMVLCGLHAARLLVTLARWRCMHLSVIGISMLSPFSACTVLGLQFVIARLPTCWVPGSPGSSMCHSATGT